MMANYTWSDDLTQMSTEMPRNLPTPKCSLPPTAGPDVEWYLVNACPTLDNTIRVGATVKCT